jgi:hypothetical protein
MAEVLGNTAGVITVSSCRLFEYFLWYLSNFYSQVIGVSHKREHTSLYKEISNLQFSSN